MQQKPRLSGALMERMMGLEPTTFCMATEPCDEHLLRYSAWLSHPARQSASQKDPHLRTLKAGLGTSA